MKRSMFLWAGGGLVAAPALAFAQTPSAPKDPASVLKSLFTTPPSPDMFAASFKSGMPFDTMQALLLSYQRTIGSPSNISLNGKVYDLTFASGIGHAAITLDASGAITALLFQPPATTAGADRLKAVYDAPKLNAAWFAPSILNIVTPAALQSVMDGVHAQYGALRSVAPGPSGYTMDLANGTLNGIIHTDPDGKIDVLFFSPQPLLK